MQLYHLGILGNTIWETQKEIHLLNYCVDVELFELGFTDNSERAKLTKDIVDAIISNRHTEK
jgi:hypothetical protein